MKVYLCSTVGTTVNLILQQLAIPQHGVYLQFNHTSQSQKKELPKKEELLTSRFNCMQMSDACTPFLSFPETFQKHTHAITKIIRYFIIYIPEARTIFMPNEPSESERENAFQIEIAHAFDVSITTGQFWVTI